jgi:predicted naringenin-chalcone synthase
MFFAGIGTATPPQRYTQAQCWEALQHAPQFAQLDRRARSTLQHVLLGKNGIQTRALAVDPLHEVFVADPDALHRRFARYAPSVATDAAQIALRRAQLRACGIDAVIVSTCTGYLCPGLTSYVAESLGLRDDILALDLVGQGCGAALPNLRTADALLRAGTAETVLSVCVEICSAAFYIDNDPGVLVSACLFGDGAGAAVLTSSPVVNSRKVEWVTAASLHNPAERDALRFEHTGGVLRNVLTPEVPALAAAHAQIVLEDVLGREGLGRDEIGTWLWHAGGRKVLEALQHQFNLSAAELRWSRQVLNDYGNLSSAFVYFVLEAALEDRAPAGSWWMSSFGAGFSCHGALLKVA